jgi:hypothetical protein
LKQINVYFYHSYATLVQRRLGPFLLLHLLAVPLDAVGELDARTAKDVQGTSNRQVHLAVAELLDQLEILNRAAAAGVRDGNGTPLGQLGNQLVVDAALQALYVGGVDEELGAVRFEEGD